MHKVVQSVLFNKKVYSPAESIAWLHQHNYSFDKIHTTEKYHRFRQFDPDYTDNSKMFLTVKSKTPGVKFVIFISKKDYKYIRDHSSKPRI